MAHGHGLTRQNMRHTDTVQRVRTCGTRTRLNASTAWFVRSNGYTYHQQAGLESVELRHLFCHCLVNLLEDRSQLHHGLGRGAVLPQRAVSRDVDDREHAVDSQCELTSLIFSASEGFTSV